MENYLFHNQFALYYQKSYIYFFICLIFYLLLVFNYKTHSVWVYRPNAMFIYQLELVDRGIARSTFKWIKSRAYNIFLSDIESS